MHSSRDPITVLDLGELKADNGELKIGLNFTNPKHIPPEIPRIEVGKTPVAQVNAIIKAAEAEELTRERLTAISTPKPGVQVVNNLANVSLSRLRVGLVNNQMQLVDVHCRQKPSKDGKPPKWVVNLTFAGNTDQGNLFNGEDPLELTRRIEEPIRSLLTNAWGYAHVWDNRPAGANLVVIDVVKKLPRDSVPEWLAKVENGQVLFVPR